MDVNWEYYCSDRREYGCDLSAQMRTAPLSVTLIKRYERYRIQTHKV